MDDGRILYEAAQGVAVVTLNRPQVMNALDAPLRAALLHALLRGGAEARCVVLTGAGAAFCAGQDLTEPEAVADIEGTLGRDYVPLLHAILDCPVPVIAAVNGAAAGAGANLALAADVVIAAEGAFFQQAFARIGLVPDAGGTFLLPRLVGQARAAGACLFAERIPARQAADWGMIWEAVPEPEFAARWRARATALAEGPTLAFRELRGLLRGAATADLAAQLRAEAAAHGRCGRTADFREGLAAFADRRAPRVEGR